MRPGAAVVTGANGARGLAARLDGRPFTVGRVEDKPSAQAVAPFIHLDLQQEGGAHCALVAATRTAQRLTRTVHHLMAYGLREPAETASSAARTQIAALYRHNVPPQPRRTGR